MKKIFLLCTISFYSLAIYAQDMQKEKVEAMKAKVIKFFNAQNADSLYTLAGEAFKKQLSPDKFNEVCDNNLFPLGNIQSAELVKFEQGVGKYKTTFDAGVFSMFLGLDATGKLESFLFQPYKEEPTGEIKKTVTDNKLSDEMDKKIDAILQPFMFKSQTVGLSIGILKDGKTSFYNYGETKKGNGKIPSSKNLYEIGSVTKTFTGILLAKAVIEKKISLNDPVNKYLPKDIPVIKFGNDTLKIIHLSNHTSGLPPLPDNLDLNNNLSNPYKNYDATKLFAFLKTAKLTQKPGAKFEYCNLSVGLLGTILETVNKMPFEKMVTSFICAKAGMNATKQLLTKKDSVLFMQGYDGNISAQGEWDFKTLAAAGCLRSNAEDMLKYAAINLNSKDIAFQKAIELSHQPTFEEANQKIGLNWFIQNWEGKSVLFHGGETGGYKSFLAINPKTKNAVVILSNTAVSNDEIGVAILKYLDK
jgi:CubicO group peptidase (beta-lactamase class C family)